MNRNSRIPGVLIAAPGSGSGKTLITCALLQILKKNNYEPASFKCGPDYIDPMFHEEVLETPSNNLDSFFLDKESLIRVFNENANGNYNGRLARRKAADTAAESL